MHKVTIAAVALAAGFAVPAFAQGGPPPDPFGDSTVSRADFDKNSADRFDQLDANHDGMLAPEERPFGGRGPGGNAGPMSKDEFVAQQGNRFDRMDADHDGKLTKKERVFVPSTSSRWLDSRSVRSMWPSQSRCPGRGVSLKASSSR